MFEENHFQEWPSILLQFTQVLYIISNHLARGITCSLQPNPKRDWVYFISIATKPEEVCSKLSHNKSKTINILNYKNPFSQLRNMLHIETIWISQPIWCSPIISMANIVNRVCWGIFFGQGWDRRSLSKTNPRRHS